jgi:hypothetical protein
MARRPYIFCRYQITDDDGPLNVSGQMQFFQENQGQFKPHNSRADRPPANAIIQEASALTSGRYDAVSFYIGYQPGYRTKRGYDPRTNRRTAQVVDDDNIKSAHIVSVPGLLCMAIEDRIGDHNVPHGTAISALRSIVRAVFEDGDLNVSHLTDDDVRRIVRDWELIQYDYVVRPLNPIRVSDFAELRSEKMKTDHVAMDSGQLRPAEGDSIEDNGGIFSETEAVVREGYGQSGGRAITPEGHEARFPRPKFHMNKEKNFAEREKTRFLKILFEVDDDGQADSAGIARTLVQFYKDAFPA